MDNIATSKEADMPDDKFSDTSQNPPVDGVPPQAAAGDRKPNGEAPEEPVPMSRPSRRAAKAQRRRPTSRRPTPNRRRRSNGRKACRTKTGRAGTSTSPGSGRPRRTAVERDRPRRRRCRFSRSGARSAQLCDGAEEDLAAADDPIRIFPKSVGVTTVYMLSLKREAQDDGDLDTYPVSQPVREG